MHSLSGVTDYLKDHYLEFFGINLQIAKCNNPFEIQGNCKFTDKFNFNALVHLMESISILSLLLFVFGVPFSFPPTEILVPSLFFFLISLTWTFYVCSFGFTQGPMSDDEKYSFWGFTNGVIFYLGYLFFSSSMMFFFLVLFESVKGYIDGGYLIAIETVVVIAFWVVVILPFLVFISYMAEVLNLTFSKAILCFCISFLVYLTPIQLVVVLVGFSEPEPSQWVGFGLSLSLCIVCYAYYFIRIKNRTKNVSTQGDKKEIKCK
ncbi:hypothetical protein [Pseudomaricurvus sp.]|uniref:hypothetical protein n=1 Tax=Pseudomaricurvus sp. TaxID=2004510 RepID=UPI003F6AECE0